MNYPAQKRKLHDSPGSGPTKKPAAIAPRPNQQEPGTYARTGSSDLSDSTKRKAIRVVQYTQYEVDRIVRIVSHSAKVGGSGIQSLSQYVHSLVSGSPSTRPVDEADVNKRTQTLRDRTVSWKHALKPTRHRPIPMARAPGETGRASQQYSSPNHLPIGSELATAIIDAELTGDPRLVSGLSSGFVTEGMDLSDGHVPQESTSSGVNALDNDPRVLQDRDQLILEQASLPSSENLSLSGRIQDPIFHPQPQPLQYGKGVPDVHAVLPSDFLFVDHSPCIEGLDTDDRETYFSATNNDTKENNIFWVLPEGLAELQSVLGSGKILYKDFKRDHFGNSLLHAIAARGPRPMLIKALEALDSWARVPVAGEGGQAGHGHDREVWGALNSGDQTFLHCLGPKWFDQDATGELKALLKRLSDKQFDLNQTDLYGRSVYHLWCKRIGNEALVRDFFPDNKLFGPSLQIDAFGYAPPYPPLQSLEGVPNHDFVASSSVVYLDPFDPISNYRQPLENGYPLYINPAVLSTNGLWLKEDCIGNALHYLAIRARPDAEICQDLTKPWTLQSENDTMESLAARLIEDGADVNCYNDVGNTVLMEFVIKCRDQEQTRQVLRLLIQHGARVNARNRQGQTALHLAAKHGNLAALKELATHNANVHARDIERKSVLQTLSDTILRLTKNQIDNYKDLESCFALLSGTQFGGKDKPKALHEWELGIGGKLDDGFSAIMNHQLEAQVDTLVSRVQAPGVSTPPEPPIAEANVSQHRVAHGFSSPGQPRGNGGPDYGNGLQGHTSLRGELDGGTYVEDQHSQNPSQASQAEWPCPYRVKNPSRFNARDWEKCAKMFSMTQLKIHIRTEHCRRPASNSSEHRQRNSFEEARSHNPENLHPRWGCRPQTPDPEDGISEGGDSVLASRKSHDKVIGWEALWKVLFGEDEIAPNPEFPPIAEIYEMQGKAEQRIEGMRRSLIDTLAEPDTSPEEQAEHIIESLLKIMKQAHDECKDSARSPLPQRKPSRGKNRNRSGPAPGTSSSVYSGPPREIIARPSSSALSTGGQPQAAEVLHVYPDAFEQLKYPSMGSFDHQGQLVDNTRRYAPNSAMTNDSLIGQFYSSNQAGINDYPRARNDPPPDNRFSVTYGSGMAFSNHSLDEFHPST